MYFTNIEQTLLRIFKKVFVFGDGSFLFFFFLLKAL